MVEVEFNNLTGLALNEVFLEKTARTILQKELSRSPKKIFALSIALVKPGEIRTLNKKYRKRNRATDVLSFFYGKSGEIVICPKVVLANAKRFKSAFEKELTLVLIHGVLHLLGYDHEKSKGQAKKMRAREEYYLLSLKI